MASRRRGTSTNDAESSRRGGTARTSRSTRTRYTPLEPEYYNITISDGDARARFASLKGRGVESTRFVNREALETLGMWDDIQRLFHSVGWGYILTMHAPTYEAQVLEIASTMSIKCKNRTQPVSITFQLDGESRTLTTQEINVIYECPRNGRCESAVGLYNRDEFWRAMNNDQVSFESGKSKVSMIRNPIFRLIQRILGHTVFCRGESSNVRVEELNLLWGMLNDTHFDLGYALLKQIKRLENKEKGIISIGGMLTPLIDHFLGPRIHDLTPLGEVPTLDIPHLCQSLSHTRTHTQRLINFLRW